MIEKIKSKLVAFFQKKSEKIAILEKEIDVLSPSLSTKETESSGTDAIDLSTDLDASPNTFSPESLTSSTEHSDYFQWKKYLLVGLGGGALGICFSWVLFSFFFSQELPVPNNGPNIMSIQGNTAIKPEPPHQETTPPGITSLVSQKIDAPKSLPTLLKNSKPSESITSPEPKEKTEQSSISNSSTQIETSENILFSSDTEERQTSNASESILEKEEKATAPFISETLSENGSLSSISSESIPENNKEESSSLPSNNQENAESHVVPPPALDVSLSSLTETSLEVSAASTLTAETDSSPQDSFKEDENAYPITSESLADPKEDLHPLQNGETISQLPENMETPAETEISTSATETTSDHSISDTSLSEPSISQTSSSETSSPKEIPPYIRNAQESNKSGKPQISLVVVGLGLDEKITDRVLKDLPKEVTVAFVPYVNKIQKHIKTARENKREVMLMLPLEPMDYPKVDPGPLTLLTGVGEEENIRKLDRILSNGEDIIGLVGFMGSRFLTSRADLFPVLDTIKSKGYLFLDNRSTARTVAEPIAQRLGLPFVKNNRFIDEELSRASIQQNLYDLESMAHKEGRSVGIAYAYELTLDVLFEWIKTLDKNKIDLIPLTDMLNPLPRSSSSHEAQK